MPNPIAMVALLVAGIIFLILFIMVVSNFRLWLQASTSGARVGFINLFFMNLRKVNSAVVVLSRINAIKAGLNLSVDELEAHYMAGGNVPQVVKALIAASKANIPLTWQQATAIDLAGRDVLDAVRTSVHPKVIDCPDPRQGTGTVAAVAMDGIQLKAKARVTVRTNIARLVGGATEETIIARVGEGIVTTIGSSPTHKKVLENPDLISKTVLQRGLDAGTAFEILSIDIADIDVGEMVNEYRRRRNFIASAFAEMGLECHRPLGAFYAFPSVAKFKLPAKEFAMRFLHEERVAVVPGTAFGDCGEGFVRCAYATSLDNIKEAMLRLRRFIGKL